MSEGLVSETLHLKKNQNEYRQCCQFKKKKQVRISIVILHRHLFPNNVVSSYRVCLLWSQLTHSGMWGMYRMPFGFRSMLSVCVCVCALYSLSGVVWCVWKRFPLFSVSLLVFMLCWLCERLFWSLHFSQHLLGCEFSLSVLSLMLYLISIC